MSAVLLFPSCAHPGATYNVGPTTDQRNWWCLACGAYWTTFPTDAERAEAVRAAIAKAKESTS